MYQVKTRWWMRKVLNGKLIWKLPAEAPPAVYLTFDDGPHPIATPFVLDQLAAHNAKATFFCIGKCVDEFPHLYERILAEGHTVGNHTQHHLNGWKAGTEDYIHNIAEAAKRIDSRIFRPPYGRIRSVQVDMLSEAHPPWKVYMWDVLSGDFDTSITGEQCLQNVVAHLEPGSIVVFHDSQKAWDRMSYALPRVLGYCREKGWACRPLPH